MGLDQWITVCSDEEGELKSYSYRKVNFLRQWMIDHTNLDYEDNTEIVDVSLHQLKELKDECEYVLNHRDKASDILPTLCGFFFGDTNYDEWYFRDVKDLKQDLDEMLDMDIDYANYTDWW